MPPCPLSRRVPQDVWDVIQDMKPRDRDMASPTAALIKRITPECFAYIRDRRLHMRAGWTVRDEFFGPYLTVEPRSGYDAYLRWSLYYYDHSTRGPGKQVRALYIPRAHPFPPCVIMSLGMLKGPIYNQRQLQ